VGLERDEPAAAERRLLHEAGQPALRAGQAGDGLRVLELPAEEALGEEVGPEAIAEVEPVALLARRDVRELELDLALERRVLELRLLLARDPRQTRGDVLDAAAVREDVLALDLELPEDALPVAGERVQALAGQEARRVAAVVPRGAALVAQGGAQRESPGEGLRVLDVVRERAGERLHLDLDRLQRRVREAGLGDLLELVVE